MNLFRTTAILFLGFVIYTPVLSNYNGWSGEPSGSFWNKWSLGITGGITSYYGDLSYFDTDVIGKIRNESRPAIGFLLTKYLKDDVGLSGQILYGGFKGGNSTTSFTTSILEYNIQARVDVLNLLLRNNRSGVGFIVSGGVGHLYFQATKQIMQESAQQNQIHRSRVPQFVYFGGAALTVKASERLTLLAEASIRQVQNDRLDETVKNGDFDYYSYVSVGITYSIGREYSRAKQMNLNRPRARMVYR
jgi:hypothetical protein